jgi:flagellar export protein FliJ
VARHQFRLKTVEKVRSIRRDQSQAALADAFRAEQALAETAAEIAKEQAQLREMQRAATAERPLNVNRLVEAQQYDLVLRAKQQELAKQQTLLAIETERRRLAVVEAEREVRVLEMLDDRHRRAHQREAERLEAKQLDEVAAQITRRGRVN